MVNEPSSSGFYRTALLATVLLKLPILLWTALHALPMPTSDAVIFRQGALEFLRTGRFAIPCGIGRFPFAEELYSFYPPFYTYLDAEVFWLFGYSLPNALLLDIAIHSVLMLLGARLLWELTPSKALVALFIFSSTALWQTPGRPDDLGTLFALAALLLRILSQRDDLRLQAGIVAALALSGATSPSDGLLGYLAVGFYELGRPSRYRRGAVLGLRLAVMGALALAICGPAFQFRYLDALTQFSESYRIRYQPTPLELLRVWTWSPFFLMHLALVGCLFITLPRDAAFRSRHALWRTVAGLGMMLIVPCLLMHRPNYGFRLCEILLMTAGYAGLVLLTREDFAPQQLRIRRAALFGGSLLTLALVASRLGLCFIAPFFWNEQAVTYAECRARLAALIPPGEQIGCDGPMCAAAVQDPPVIALQWAEPKLWPRYIASAYTLRGAPSALTRAGWKTVIESEYELIEAPPPAALHPLFGKIGITENFSDWRFCVWRRKSS